MGPIKMLEDKETIFWKSSKSSLTDKALIFCGTDISIEDKAEKSILYNFSIEKL